MKCNKCKACVEVTCRWYGLNLKWTYHCNCQRLEFVGRDFRKQADRYALSKREMWEKKFGQEIKRYRMLDQPAEMDEYKTGEWCKYEEVGKLEQQLKAKDELIGKVIGDIVYLCGCVAPRLTTQEDMNIVVGKFNSLVFDLEKSLKGE